MKKRHIVFVTLELPYPSTSGGRIYTWERIKILKSAGYDITLFTLIDEAEQVDYNYIKTICKDIKVYTREKKYIKAIKYFWKPFSIATRFIPKMQKELLDYVHENNIDVIIADSLIIADNCLIKDVPIILTQHNIEYLAFKSMALESNNFIKKVVYFREYLMCKSYEKRLYNSGVIKGYTFISEEDKRIFETDNNDKNTVLIPMGCNLCETDNSSELFQNGKIVFSGKMNYEPNVQAVLFFCKYIYPIIKKQCSEVKFYIVGKNPTNEVKNLEKIEGVIVTGYVDSTEEYLRDANIIVIPLLSGGGVKIKLFEALSHKRIVVSTSKGVEGTIFKHKEDLLVTDDSQEFAKFCIDIISNKGKYALLGKNGYNKLINNYSWIGIGEKYVSFIESIIHNGGNQ